MIAVACAAPQGYLPGSQTVHQPLPGNQLCPDGQILKITGECALPDIRRNLFSFVAPPTVPPRRRLPKVPDPQLDYNVIMVHTPKQSAQPDPIVVPPPQQRTVVYVLTKNQEYEQKLLKVPTDRPKPPEVFYVNHKEGELPELPGDIDIEEILNNPEFGKVVDTSNNSPASENLYQ